MKVRINADSQDEFDSKRDELIKAIAGSRYDVDLEKSYKAKDSPIKAQNEMVNYWGSQFEKMIRELKKDIEKIIDE